MNNIAMKPIPSYPDYYASQDGHIFNKHGKELKAFANNVGYYLVGIWQGKKRLGRLVHRLVAETWMEGFDAALEINHIDEDKANNDISNLEQLNHRDNLVYGTRIRRMVLKRLKPVRCVETG